MSTKRGKDWLGWWGTGLAPLLLSYKQPVAAPHQDIKRTVKQTALESFTTGSDVYVNENSIRSDTSSDKIITAIDSPASGSELPASWGQGKSPPVE